MNKETLSTSEKEIPKHKNALEEKYQSKEPLNPENIQEQKSQLPVPSGWRLLVLPFTPKEKTKGGIFYAQESRQSENCRKLRLCVEDGSVGLSRPRKISNGTMVQSRRMGRICTLCRIKTSHRRWRS